MNVYLENLLKVQTQQLVSNHYRVWLLSGVEIVLLYL